MSSNQDQPLSQDSDFEKSVAEYLARHPDFFERNPEILASMRIPHKAGKAVSLIERQVAVLRDQKDEAQQRLQVLIRNAQLNEKLNNTMQTLVLELLNADSLDEVLDTIEHRIATNFNADAVSIKFMVTTHPAVLENPNMSNWSTEEMALFEKLVNQRHSVCGAFSDEQFARLFEDYSGTVQSAAMIPLVDEHDGRRNLGLLAIGSEDPQRFRADMGTLFLDYLGKVIARIAGRYLDDK